MQPVAAQGLVFWGIRSLIGEDMVKKVIESVQSVGQGLKPQNM